jgi:hypothetical protein
MHVPPGDRGGLRVDIPFRIPGTDGPDIVVRRSFLGSISLLVDGARLKPSSRRRLEWQVPLRDGTTAGVEIVGQWTGLRARVNGEEIALEARVPRWQVLVSVLPLVLVIGGIVGGVIGAVGAGINTILVRRIRSTPLRVAALVGVTVLAVGAYFVTAIAVSPLRQLAVGTCVDGIRENVALSPNNYRAIDCAQPHDDEVVGSTTYAGSGGYPGQSVLADYAQVPCVTAFESYVGGSFDASSLTMILIVPTDVTWLKGDRTIACVALSSSGAKLTGSIRGTGR